MNLINREALRFSLVFSDETGSIPCEQMKKVLEVVKAQPLAQPEIIYCKDCVKRNRKLGSLDEHYNRYNKSQCCPMIEFRGIPQGHEFDYQYCSWAERRTE